MSLMPSRSLSRFVVLLPAVLLLAGPLSGCTRDKEEDPWHYHPSKEAYQEVALQYEQEAVRQVAGGAEVVGYDELQLRLPTAEERAYDDAVVRMFRFHLLDRLAAEAPGAEEYFLENRGRPILKLSEHLTTDPNGPYYRSLPISEDAEKYELYQRYTLPSDREQALVSELVRFYRNAGPAPPVDIPFSVVLADMPADLEYDDKLSRVVQAVEQEVRGVGADSEVVVMEEEEGFDPADVATRKQRLLNSLPEGTTVEASVVFEHTSRNRLESIVITDIRGREMAPLQINEHPTPRGGRYDYSIEIPSLLIHKGQEHITVRVVEATGREFVEEYELTPNRFEYSDENIGLLEIQQFDGRVSTLLERLREVRLPDQDGRATVTLRLPTRMIFEGAGAEGREELRRTMQFQIGLYRAGATTVYALTNGRPSSSDWRNLDSVESLDWEVVWEQYDPERQWGELSAIEIPGHDSDGDLYVRIDYNNDRDTDVLRFDVHGYADGDVVEEEEAEVVFSTTRRN